MSPMIVTANAIDTFPHKSVVSPVFLDGVDKDSAFVLYIFRVPGSQDLCLSTFKPHEDVVTALDVLLAAYYVRAADDGELQILRAGQCVAVLDGNNIDVKLKIEDPAVANAGTVKINRKKIEDVEGRLFSTSINSVDRKQSHAKSPSSSSGNDDLKGAFDGLNLVALAQAAAAHEKQNERHNFQADLKEKLRTARRSAAAFDFRNQWGHRCLFYSSVTGQDLKCDQVVPNSREATTSLPVSELRFNLPTNTSKLSNKFRHASSVDESTSSPILENENVPSTSPRRKHFSAPLRKLVRNRSSITSEDAQRPDQGYSLPPYSPLHSHDVSWSDLPQPDFGPAFDSAMLQDAEESPPPLPARMTIAARTEDEELPELPPRPSQSITPLPGRPHSKSESVANSQSAFAIRRKALNSSEGSPTRSAPLEVPPMPPRHGSENDAMDLATSTYPLPDLSPSPVIKQPPRLPRRQYTGSDEVQSPVSPSSPMSPTRLDLTLGREALGGGFKGHQAKLGKLLIYPDGRKALDLVVAANIVMFWRAWRGGGDLSRPRSDSTQMSGKIG